MRHRALDHQLPLRLAVALAFGAWAIGGWACSGAVDEPADEIGVVVERVALDRNRTPVVILAERSGSRRLPIWIGNSEAKSIAVELEEDFEASRPNSHDLATRMIRGLEGEVVRVVVTELRSGVYYAVLSLRRAGGTVEIDSRPSDAIAIALRTGTPIFVREALFLADEADGKAGRSI